MRRCARRRTGRATRGAADVPTRPLRGHRGRALSRSVLIVDDDPFIRRLIATTLEDVAGFQVEEAGDGIEALEAARAKEPAIVFLDIDMPRMNGIDACRELRALDDGGAPTIVMLTAAGPDAEAEAREAGADLFLTKPFSPLDLLQLVDSMPS